MMRNRLALATLLLLALVSITGTAFAVEGRAWGDIHVRTMDGATYPFQSAGEFFASRSPAGDFEVQLRLESAGFQDSVSVATAVAVRVDTTRVSVALGREPMLFVEERPTVLPSDGSLDLPDGGRVERTKKGYEILWSDGSLLTLRVRKSHINAFLKPAEPRRGTLSGLFGNFNGRADDDVDAMTAALASEPDTAGLGEIAHLVKRILDGDDEEWLLAQDESLFEYEPGQSTRTFRRKGPSREASASTLTRSRRKQARETCEKAGVTDSGLLEACIVDVGFTRDESFAETAAEVQARGVPNWDSELARRAGR